MGVAALRGGRSAALRWRPGGGGGGAEVTRISRPGSARLGPTSSPVPVGGCSGAGSALQVRGKGPGTRCGGQGPAGRHRPPLWGELCAGASLANAGAAAPSRRGAFIPSIISIIYLYYPIIAAVAARCGLGAGPGLGPVLPARGSARCSRPGAPGSVPARCPLAARCARV